METKKIISNQELQEKLSERIRAFGKGELDVAEMRAFSSLTGKLLTAVRIDTEAQTRLGVPVFERTKDFLGLI